MEGDSSMFTSFNSAQFHENEQMSDVPLTPQPAQDSQLPKEKLNYQQMIPVEQYEVLLKLLEDEKMLHVRTKKELRETQDKLDFALGELEVLNGQLAREKRQFENAFGTLKKKALAESSKNVELENKCHVIEQTNLLTDEQLKTKEDALHKMAEKLQQQQKEHERQVLEEQLQRKQEIYISKISLSGSSEKPSKTTQEKRIPEEELYHLQQDYITKLAFKHKSK